MGKKITFSQKQLILLKESIKNPEIHKKYFEDIEKNRLIVKNHLTNRYEFFFSHDDKIQILDELSDLLTQKGFNSNWDINHEGRAIEEIIDLFI